MCAQRCRFIFFFGLDKIRFYRITTNAYTSYKIERSIGTVYSTYELVQA